MSGAAPPRSPAASVRADTPRPGIRLGEENASGPVRLGAVLAVFGLHVGALALVVGAKAAVPPVIQEPPVLMVDLAPAPSSLNSPTEDSETPEEAEPEVAPEPEPPEPEPTPEPEPEPEPEPKPEPEPEPKKPDPSKRPPPTPKREPPQAANPPPRPAASAPTQAAAAPVASGAVVKSWQGRVLAHLERRKRYPSAAKTRNLEGVALIRIVIDRNGVVLSSTLQKSSGHAVLDREGQALAQRASPLPPPPPGMGGRTVSLVVPVSFTLR